MSKYVIDSSTLTSIADAVRTKGGTTAPIVVSDIPTAIANLPSGGGGGLTAEDLTFSGDLGEYFCSGQIGKVILNKYKDLFTFNSVTSGTHMFSNTDKFDLSNLTIYFDETKGFDFNYAFFNSTITALPKLSGKILNNSYNQSPFSNMYYIREIPSYVYEDLDTSLVEAKKNCGLYKGFVNMYSLKEYPEGLINKFRAYSKNSTYAGYYHTFSQDYALSDITNFPINTNNFTSNCFNETFNYCSRLKNMTFELNNDNLPIQVNWKNQNIILSTYTGFCLDASNILKYNSGITADKEVTDDATYQALKNDPDWFTTKTEYSRYNHDSAVATINSLPDTSAYLATAGGTNTIKFNGQAGALTDGGAINTLTEQEIAVAAAKGWTVTLT